MNSLDRRLLLWIAAIAVSAVVAMLAFTLAISSDPKPILPLPTVTDTPSSAPVVPSDLVEPTRGVSNPGDSMYIQLPALWGERRIAIVPTAAVDGVFTPPGDPQMLGWWSGGAPIGSTEGRALVAGHTVHTGGGALDDLETMSPDDQITVMSDNALSTFLVVSVEILRDGQYAERAEQIVRQTGPTGLVVMTCEDWNGSTYESNVVVIAELVSQEVFTHR